jgi:hypothetical protein
MIDIVDRLRVVLDKYRGRYKRVGWQPVVEDAIHEIERLRSKLALSDMMLEGAVFSIERLRSALGEQGTDGHG